jgi:hypothetical protein
VRAFDFDDLDARGLCADSLATKQADFDRGSQVLKDALRKVANPVVSLAFIPDAKGVVVEDSVTPANKPISIFS